MAEWRAKCPNDYGEYEITFATKNQDEYGAVVKLCQAVMDGRVKSVRDYEILVRCENCKHREEGFQDGEPTCWCSVNDDPYCYHVVDGRDGEFCCHGVKNE